MTPTRSGQNMDEYERSVSPPRTGSPARSSRPRLGLTPRPALALVLMLSAAAMGQEQYILTDDDQWIEIEPIDPASPEGQLAEARHALAIRDFIRSENLVNRWIERFPQHSLLGEAHLIRGDIKRARKDYYKALFDYEFVARSFPGSEAFISALERELEIARLFATGTRRKLWGLRFVDATEEAEEILIRIQERLPGSRLAEDAGMELADYYFRIRNMSLAAEAYDLFIENYPDSERVSKARRRLIYAHLASFKGPEYDAAGLEEARLRLLELRAVEPAVAQKVGADALLVRIDESNAMKLLENARWYLRVGDPVAAELTIRRLVQTYMNTVAASEALRLVESILPRLPERVREQAPDYAQIRTGMLGEPSADASNAESDAEPQS